MQTITRRLLPVAVAGLVALGVAASAVAAPARHAADTLTFCTDATYPPEEFYQGTKLVGSDIDIGTEIAKRIGLKSKFQNTGFDGIIAALLAKKCDAIISGMNDTAERRKQVAFVDYLSVGQSLMVKKGNPKKISTLTSLSGKSVSVEVGTTNKQFLDRREQAAGQEGQAGDQGRHLPEGHGRRERAQDGTGRRLLRRLAGRRVLHQEGHDLRVRGSTGQSDRGRDRDPER